MLKFIKEKNKDVLRQRSILTDRGTWYAKPLPSVDMSTNTDGNQFQSECTTWGLGTEEAFPPRYHWRSRKRVTEAQIDLRDLVGTPATSLFLAITKDTDR